MLETSNLINIKRIKVPAYEYDFRVSTISIADIKSRRFDLLERKCPVCEVIISRTYPYHPEDDCDYGVIYNVDRV
jgi:hypothetical protein